MAENAVSPAPGAGAATDASRDSVMAAEWASVNPMIDPDGDTYRVSSALVALASLLADQIVDGPDGARDFGLSVILETAAAALRRMGEIER